MFDRFRSSHDKTEITPVPKPLSVFDQLLKYEERRVPVWVKRSNGHMQKGLVAHVLEPYMTVEVAITNSGEIPTDLRSKELGSKTVDIVEFMEWQRQGREMDGSVDRKDSPDEDRRSREFADTVRRHVERLLRHDASAKIYGGDTYAIYERLRKALDVRSLSEDELFYAVQSVKMATLFSKEAKEALDDGRIYFRKPMEVTDSQYRGSDLERYNRSRSEALAELLPHALALRNLLSIEVARREQEEEAERRDRETGLRRLYEHDTIDGIRQKIIVQQASIIRKLEEVVERRGSAPNTSLLKESIKVAEKVLHEKQKQRNTER